MPAAGRPVEQLDKAKPTDGTEILFGSHGSIYVVNPDGSGLRQIGLAIHGRAYAGDDPVWSPDGTRIAFALAAPNSQGIWQEGIAVANADGTDVHQVTTAPLVDAHPDWGAHPVTAST